MVRGKLGEDKKKERLLYRKRRILNVYLNSSEEEEEEFLEKNGRKGKERNHLTFVEKTKQWQEKEIYRFPFSIFPCKYPKDNAFVHLCLCLYEYHLLCLEQIISCMCSFHFFPPFHTFRTLPGILDHLIHNGISWRRKSLADQILSTLPSSYL